ncbi:MAG: 1,4-dihydroxy-2-naphthoate polyprenyltransferase [Nitriliruptoraceae bacterium]
MRAHLEAARPRTLPAAVAPVLVGTAAAHRAPFDLSVGRALLALVVALALQVAVNYANDLFDGLKGVDTAQRTGPRRAVASGLITPRAMAWSTGIALFVAALAGLTLAWLVGWELLLVGVGAMVAVLGYSGGRHPYASRGLGELSVFVFFGVVATVGSQYVQDGHIGLVSVVASVPIGFLAVGLLVVNNLRDIPTDELAGKRTLAVRLGDGATRTLFTSLLLGALVGLGVLALAAGSPWPLLGLVAAPLGLGAVAVVRGGATGRELVPALERTARFQLLLALGAALGLLVAGSGGALTAAAVGTAGAAVGTAGAAVGVVT